MNLLTQLLEQGGDLPVRVRQAYRSAECLVDAGAISRQLDQLAVTLTLLLQDTNPVIITLLPGAGVLSGQLAGRMVFPAESIFLQGESAAGKFLDSSRTDNLKFDGRVVLLLNDYAEGRDMEAAMDWAVRHGAGEIRCAGVVGFASRDSSTDAGAYPSHAAVRLREEPRPLMGTGLSFCGYGQNLPGLYAINDIGEEKT